VANLGAFVEAFPHLDITAKELSLSLPFLLSIQAMHQKAERDEDAALQAVVKQLAQQLQLTNMHGLCMPVSSKVKPPAVKAPAPPPPKAPAAAAATPPPPATSAAASKPVVTTIQQLQALFAGIQPHLRPKPNAWDLDLDLHNQSLLSTGYPSTSSSSSSAALVIDVPEGARVRLSNGSLFLMRHSHIRVNQNSLLQLDNINITGVGPTTGNQGHGLLLVQGKGATAILNKCKVIMCSWPRPEECRPDCVHVGEGAAATLNACTLSGSVWAGLGVRGNATATASHCTADDCEFAGFACWGGGQLSVNNCTSTHNKDKSLSIWPHGHGFVSAYRGSVMEVGPGCTALFNGGAGFLSDEGAVMKVQEGCTSSHNHGAGFAARDAETLIIVGSGCKALSNRKQGFCASGGACIKITERSIASTNGGSGFCAKGKHSVIEAGPGCAATTNWGHGFDSASGGRVTIKGSSVCSGNEHHARMDAVIILLLSMVMYLIRMFMWPAAK
jgi:hypothetical protein